MKASGRFARLGGNVISAVVMASMLASCQLTKNQMQQDRADNFDRQDYRDALKPMPPPPAAASAAPDFQPVLSTPQELRLPAPLVTVKVNNTVGLRDLLYQLAEQAGVDLELDPQIHGSIIFTATDRPFDEVVDRICTMASLRYTYENKVLNVRLDRPYIQTYPVGFLNVLRDGSSKISVTSSASSGGSSTNLKGDLWKDLNDGLKQVLLASDLNIPLASLMDPVAQPVNPTPPPLPPSDPNAPPPPPPAPGSPQVAPMPAAATPQLNIATAPAGDPVIPNPPSNFSISQQTGNVSVFASERQQKLVKKFLNDFARRVTTQVLIEAKVLSVELTDQYAAGIDWSKLGGGNSKFPQSGDINFIPTVPFAGLAATGTFSGTLNHILGTDFALTITALEQFGTIRTLSSPRVTVMNNQAGIVNVTEDNVYMNFTAQVTPATATSAATVALNSTQKNAPDGIILVVIPTANPDTGQITMAVRPTVSVVYNHFTDPTIALTLALNNVSAPASLQNNSIPELSVQEIDSELNMQSGQMMALGGLMKDTNTTVQNGVPIASEIPIIGSLFKNSNDSIVKAELVILLKATVIAGSNIDDSERKTFRVFSLDRHPGNL